MSGPETPPVGDVVETRAEAEALARPPLLILASLRDFLDRHGIGSGEMEVWPIGHGHSNVTYAIRRGDLTVVLRRPPRPPLPPRTHDVLRESRILKGLKGHARVPEVLAECEDPEVIGMPFFIMTHIDALVVGPELPPAFDSPASRRSLGEELVDALVELHSIDQGAAGLDRLGRPSGYLERQLATFGGLWQQNRTRDLPEMKQVADWLDSNRPDSAPSVIVHGDYRLGNVMFSSDQTPELVAILDWEMVTLGDPLADLGYMVAMWAEPGDDETPMSVLSAATRLDGFLSRDDLRQRYELQSGRGTDDLKWYETLALWKSAIFLEGSYSRFLAGNEDDPYFATLDQGVPALARAALTRLSSD